MYNIVKTLLYVVSISIFASFFENKSNFNSEYIIPLFVALETKYYVGDWDKGKTYSYLDIAYWILILFTSYISVTLMNKFSPILTKYIPKIDLNISQ
tara:strand:+ start:544 stop:834 length:291 start_codon:yes stop_codon:yes gene_type:complete